jgi:predicted PurR-regulated permease PerM
VEQWLGQVGGVAMSIGGSVVGALLAASLVLIGAIYFLADSRKSLLDPALAPLPAHRRSQIEAALDELGPKLRWWLIGVLCSMTLVALISWLGYQISGVKFAVPLAIFAGLCELVPTIGPIIGGIVAIAVAGTQGTDQAVGAAITWIVVQTLESYLILPLVMRKAVEIPSIVTLFSVIFWGEVFGLPGLLLAIPLNLLIWAFYKHLVVLPRVAGRHLVGVTSGTLAKADSS